MHGVSAGTSGSSSVAILVFSTFSQLEKFFESFGFPPPPRLFFSTKKPGGARSDNDFARLTSLKIFARRKMFSKTVVCEAHRIYDWNLPKINQSINQLEPVYLITLKVWNMIGVRLGSLPTICCLVHALSAAISFGDMHPACEWQQKYRPSSPQLPATWYFW